MAGHSKWKQIKRKKAVTDAKRGAQFTRLIKEITVAARTGRGGGDAAGKSRLRAAIDAAKAANMPSENIERAIKKGTGELEGVSYVEITYEGYGPGGAAILIEVTTDNANRTVAGLRRLFGRFDGRIAAAGSVAWMFDRRGQIVIPASRSDEDRALEAALEGGALDLVKDGDQYLVTTEVQHFHAVQDALRRHGIVWDSADLVMIPKSTVRVEGKDAEQLLKLMEALEEHDDVSRASSNFDVDLEALAAV